MANNFNLIVMFFAIFATLAAAAPANVLERALKSFPSSVLCPVTPNTPYAKTFTGKAIKDAVAAFPESATTVNKLKGFPKEFRLADDGGAWPFTETTACDAYKSKTGEIFEVPIGGAGQVWGKFGTSAGNYRVLFAIVDADHIYCGMTAHADKKVLSKIVECECTH